MIKPVKQTPRLKISPNDDGFEIVAAREALEVIGRAIHERGRCLLALSGGHSPRGVYRRLGDLLVSRRVDASCLHLIFVDERMVPPGHSDSNYGMIQREFISRIPIPASQVYRIRGEANADEAARDYERMLSTLLPLFAGRCDLMVLGVGEDGHTASLFPGTEILHDKKRDVQAVFVPRLNAWRVSLTLRIINSTRSLFFLAKGAQKAAIVGRIFANPHPREDLPASLVQPDLGTIVWMLDSDAASQIPPERVVSSSRPIS